MNDPLPRGYTTQNHKRRFWHHSPWLAALAPPKNINNFCERLLRNNKQTQKKIGNEDVELLPINLPMSQNSADVVWSKVI
jgi:hypothetical protein